MAGFGGPYRTNATNAVTPKTPMTFIEQLRKATRDAEERLDRERREIAKWLLEEIKKTAQLASAIGWSEILVAQGQIIARTESYESLLQKALSATVAEVISQEARQNFGLVQHPAFNYEMKLVLGPMLESEGFKFDGSWVKWVKWENCSKK